MVTLQTIKQTTGATLFKMNKEQLQQEICLFKFFITMGDFDKSELIPDTNTPFPENDEEIVRHLVKDRGVDLLKAIQLVKEVVITDDDKVIPITDTVNNLGVN